MRQRRRRQAAAPKRDVLVAQGLANQMAIERTFDSGQAGDTRGEMPAGRGQQGGFADLAAELIRQRMPFRELRQPQRRNVSAALR